MARYLWVGMDVNPTEQSIDDGLHVDQYCWNKAGNWKKWIYQTGSYRWIDTFETPGAYDEVVVGYDGSNNTPGWIPARSPLLFGGYSGDVSAGSWGNTSTSGTTFNSSIFTFRFNQGTKNAVIGSSGGVQERIYPFPFLGGGITGTILDWVAERDGLPKYAYDAVYSLSGRDPAANLKLKVSFDINIDTTFAYNLTDGGITLPSQINSDNRLIVDINCVKSLIAGGSGPTGGAFVFTRLRYNDVQVGPAASQGNGLYPIPTSPYTGTPPTGGLRVRGGAFDIVNITPPYPNYISTFTPYRDVTDYGVELHNVVAREVNASKRQYTLHNGCTYARMKLSQYGWENTTQYAMEGLSGSNDFYAEQVPTEIRSNFDSPSAFVELYGITMSSQVPSEYKNGILLLTDTPVKCKTLGTTTTVPAVVYDIDNRAVAFPEPPGFYQDKQVVILGDKVGNTNVRIPTIEMNTPSGAYHYFPWTLEYAGTVTNTTISNNAGFLRSNQDIDRAKIVAIGQLNLSNHGVMDFSNNSDLFDNWRFGGISGAVISGGILFTDETGRVYGSEGVRLWNTQAKGMIYDGRLGSTTTVVGWQSGGDVAV